MSYASEILAVGAVAHWRLGEASGNPQDSAGTNHVNGVVGTTPTYNVASLIPSDSANKAMTFAGATMMTVPDAAALDVGDNFTIGFTMSRSDAGLGNGDAIFWKGSTGGNAPGIFFVGDLPTLYNAGAAQNIAFCTAVTDSTTVRLMVTKNGTTIHWYRNGVQTTDDIANTTAFGNSTDQLLLASATGLANPFSGTLDEIFLVNRAITAGEVATIDAAAVSSTVPLWVSPADAASMDITPTLRFTSPVSASPQHFELQLDTANTFNTGSLRDLATNATQLGWEYFDGTVWQPFPSTGLPANKSGNDVRYTVAPALSVATWYRRVRAGV